MAVVVKAFDGTRISAAESETDNGTWDEWDAAKSPTQETDIVYQRGGSNAAISLKVGTSETGVEFEDDATVDLSTTPRVILFKVWITNFAVLNTIGPTAAVLYIGSGTTTDRYNYYVLGAPGSSEREFPPAGGWQFIPIDPNVTAWRDATDGTPALGSADYYAISATFTATSKSENVVMDAIDYIDSGAGLTVTRGDGASDDAVFQDFVDHDEGTEANRWGVVRTVEGIVYVNGTLTIGESATATEFTDSNAVLVWPHTLTDVGFGGLELDAGNASTTISLTDCVFKSNGKSNLKRWADTIDELDDVTDEFDITAHGYLTGEAVLYSAEGGTAVSGLTTATEYFVEAVTADAFALHATRQAAMTAATPINLTDPGTAEQHSFRRQPDTRATLTVTGTAGTVTVTRCTFDRFRLLTLTSAATLDTCQLVNCTGLTAAQGAVTDCTITAPLLAEGEAFLTTPDLADISGCTFIAGDDGHAVEITATGTYSFNDNILTGYWTHSGTAGDGAEFGTTSGVNGTTEVITTNAAHGLVDGDAVYYNDGGGAVSVGLTDGNRYYVNEITTTTLSLHVTKQDATSDTNRVNLTASGAETHALYSTKAAILNNSGGLVTINVNGGTLPYVRNAGNSDTATVSVSETVTVTVVDATNTPIQNVQTTVRLGSDNSEIINADTNASGIASGSYSGSTPASVFFKCRKSSTGATKYITKTGPGTIATGTGMSITVQLDEDPNA